MKTTIKTLLLGFVAVGMLAGCKGNPATASSTNNGSSNIATTSSNGSSSEFISSSNNGQSGDKGGDSSIISSSQTSSSNQASSSSYASSSSQTSSSSVIEIQIVLTADKNKVEVNEGLTINSNVEGVTLTANNGASVVNGVFTATQPGTYVVTATKEGNYIEGSITIEVYKVEQIVLTADKESILVNEPTAINCNVVDATYSVSEGGFIEDGYFYATKEGNYTITAHKEGDYLDGTLNISVSFEMSPMQVKAYLKGMSIGQNYTLKCSNLLGNQTIIRTKNYYYDSQMKEGQALFTNIIPNTQFDKVAHYFKLNNNELIVGNDVVYTTPEGADKIATDLYPCDDFNYLKLDGMTVDKIGDAFYTTDDDLFNTISKLLKSEFVLYADKLEFKFNDDDLVIRAIFLDPYSGDVLSEYTNQIGELVFSNIYSTKDQSLEQLINDYTISEEGMNEDVASSFMGIEGHLKSVVRQVVDEQETVLGSVEYNYDDEYLVREVNDGTSIKREFFERDFRQDEAYYIAISPDNNVIREKYGSWNEFTFPFKELTLDDFRQTGEHTYTYFGYDSNGISGALAWTTLSQNPIIYITATEQDGLIASFHCETINTISSIDVGGTTRYVPSKYIIDIEVLDFEYISRPEPFDSDSVSLNVRSAIEKLTCQNANYSMFIADHLAADDSFKKVKVTDKTILIEEYNDSKNESKYWGYHTLDDGVIQFSATANGNTASVKLVKDINLGDKPLVSLLGFNVAPETLYNTGDYYVFKDGVINGGSALFNVFKYREYAITNTITFYDHGMGEIFKMEYKIGSSDYDLEYALFDDYDRTSFDSAFEQDLISKLATIRDNAVPTSWEEEFPEAYNLVLGLLGPDNIHHFAYVYDPEVSGNLVRASLNDSGNMVSIRFAEKSSQTFSENYKKALIAACVATGMNDESTSTAFRCTLVIGEKKLTIQVLPSTIGVLFKEVTQ